MHVRFGFLWESTRIALQSIWSHKLRTFLTLLGIIIGVASVMVVGAGIEGLQTYVVDSVTKTLGSNSFIVAKFARMGDVSEEEWKEMAKRNKDIKFADIEYLRRLCPACEEVAGEINSNRSLYYDSEEIHGTSVNGTTANRIFLGGQELQEGRFFTDEEVRRSRSVCVIGWDVYEKFFEGQDALGKTIKLGAEPLRVIGVLEKMGSTFGMSLDNNLFLPITTFQKIYGTRRSINIRGTAQSRDLFETAVGQIRTAMRTRHKLGPSDEDTFGIISTEEINSFVDEFTQMIAVVVVPITLISLVVGGIVVMNIMLVSVTERTFEIGLRKSLGARRRDILNQFLIESFFLAASGGLIGMGVATILATLIENTTPMTMTISIGYIVLAVGVSGGIGIIFGIYPAFTASKLDPIEALREDR
ncbi:MAG: ABC transporter permease [Acidobacteriota bacterium]|nr:MAG: ABC transporter permease [Acidobacteriota bacterium]